MGEAKYYARVCTNRHVCVQKKKKKKTLQQSSVVVAENQIDKRKEAKARFKMCTRRCHFSPGCRLEAAKTEWRRAGLPLSSERPVYFRPLTQGCLSLRIWRKAENPKSFLALHTPLSISSTKTVFLHRKEDGAYYGIPLLPSALKYRSGGYA